MKILQRILALKMCQLYCDIYIWKLNKNFLYLTLFINFSRITQLLSIPFNRCHISLGWQINIMAYELSLCDMNLARLLEKFYMIHMKLMKDWGEYDDTNARFGGKGMLPKLWSYLPENCISDFLDSFTEIIKCNPKEYRAFTNETIIGIYEFCIGIMRTNGQFITDKYTKAKALELMTVFVYSDQKGELMQEYAKSYIFHPQSPPRLWTPQSNSMSTSNSPARACSSPSSSTATIALSSSKPSGSKRSTAQLLGVQWARSSSRGSLIA